MVCAYCGNERGQQHRCDGCGAAKWIPNKAPPPRPAAVDASIEGWYLTHELIEVTTFGDTEQRFIPGRRLR
jgi:hypothetical protein